MNYKGKKDKTFYCLNCKVEFKFKGYSSHNKFCSIKCSNDYKIEQNKNKNKKLFDQGKLKYRRQIYTFLVERDGNKCNLCGITEWRGQPIRLWVDHIDGDATNNKPNNFQLICPNCDSQSKTFGGRNHGNGRKSRGLKPYG